MPIQSRKLLAKTQPIVITPQDFDLLKVTPKIIPPLDPKMCPASLVMRNFRNQLRATCGDRHDTLVIGLEREGGLSKRFELPIFPHSAGRDEENFIVAERTVKFLLYAVGGVTVSVAGPGGLTSRLSAAFRDHANRRFDAEIMSMAYSEGSSTRQFKFRIVPTANQIPATKVSAKKLGGHTNGCRIGFDLGGSDIKIALSVDGQSVWAKEFKWKLDDPDWRPVNERDPNVHFQLIVEKIDIALNELNARYSDRKLDAIGGSSAGIIVDNEIRVASLFRAVKADNQTAWPQAKATFRRLAEHYKVPFEAINDGEVTALAGWMSLENKTGVIGIAMGTSTAGGYCTKEGKILGWLNEFAFMPFFFGPDGAKDGWSGDQGVAAPYFSQQALETLIPRLNAREDSPKIEFSPDTPLADQLIIVQGLARAESDPRAKVAQEIFQTIGTQFGYAIAHLADFYDFETVLTLGRVLDGLGGDIIIENARAVLQCEFPELAHRLNIVTEKDNDARKTGQAAAAASLPEVA